MTTVIIEEAFEDLHRYAIELGGRVAIVHGRVELLMNDETDATVYLVIAKPHLLGDPSDES